MGKVRGLEFMKDRGATVHNGNTKSKVVNQQAKAPMGHKHTPMTESHNAPRNPNPLGDWDKGRR